MRALRCPAFVAHLSETYFIHEEQRQDVVLVPGRVHAAAQLVAASPERRVEVGFSDGHGGWGSSGAVRLANQDYRAVRAGSRDG